MKKLLSIGVILSLLLAMLTGCQSPGPEQDLGDKFIFEEDNQYYFYLSGLFGKPIAESETSYYASVDEYVYTRDKETGECTPLCNKPDCTHDDREFLVGGASNCNAYFGAVQQISYYKGKLYVLSVNTVYEMDASGSTRKKLIESKEYISASMVHRGYLYLTFSDYHMASEEYAEEELKDLSYRIERYRLDQWDGKPEVVYRKTGEWGQLHTMFAYGNRAYFDITGAETSRIMLYHLADNSLSEISGISGYPCVVDGKLLYFEQPEELIKNPNVENISEIQAKNMAILAELDGTPIQETQMSQTYSRIFGNKELVAADNYLEVVFEEIPKEKRGIRFFDKDLNFIREVNLKNEIMSPLGMNEDYFFYMKRLEETDEVQVWALDLHKLDDPDLKGEPFFVTEE